MIDNLNLKSQVKMFLIFNGIKTIQQLKKLTLIEARHFKGLGRKGINDIINALSNNGGFKIL